MFTNKNSTLQMSDIAYLAKLRTDWKSSPSLSARIDNASDTGPICRMERPQSADKSLLFRRDMHPGQPLSVRSATTSKSGRRPAPRGICVAHYVSDKVLVDESEFTLEPRGTRIGPGSKIPLRLAGPPSAHHGKAQIVGHDGPSAAPCGSQQLADYCPAPLSHG